MSSADFLVTILQHLFSNNRLAAYSPQFFDNRFFLQVFSIKTSTKFYAE